MRTITWVSSIAGRFFTIWAIGGPSEQNLLCHSHRTFFFFPDKWNEKIAKLKSYRVKWAKCLGEISPGETRRAFSTIQTWQLYGMGSPNRQSSSPSALWLLSSGSLVVPEIVLSGSVETWGSVCSSKKGVCVGTLSARSTDLRGDTVTLLSYASSYFAFKTIFWKVLL